MIAIERLSLKLQEWFGKDYKIIPYQNVCTDYTTARQVVENGNVGYVMDYTDEFTKLKRDKVVGVVNLQNPQMTNTQIYNILDGDQFYYITSSFTIDFSVPANTVKKDIYNENVGEQGIDFFGKYQEIVDTIKLLKGQYGYVDFAMPDEIERNIKYKGNIVLNEPTFVGLEDDGAFKYANYRISGAYAISKNAIYGGEYHVYIKDGIGGSNQYWEILGINSFTEMLVNNGNAINKQGSTKTEQNLSDSSWVCTISLDDFEPVEFEQSFNIAKKILYEMIHRNIEIINPNETKESKKRKVPVKIITPHGYTHIFDAIVNITFTTTSNGVGTYNISFTDDNKG